MKLRLFAPGLTCLAIALGTTASISQPSYAQSTTFFCGTSKGRPATIARTSRGDVPMIRWRSKFFHPEYSSQQRCEQVSARFQAFYNQGTLKYIRTGTVKGYPVLCIANSQGGDCETNGLIVTLRPGTDPQLVMERLLNLRARAAGKPIELSGSQLVFYADGEVYVDIEQLLDVAPVE
ncbi:MAG TPA: COP23 domain-containing protein [Candidatus Obscuribacterales bacterium]